MPNYPTPPTSGSPSSSSFPSDLLQEGRKYYTSISLVKYEYIQQFGSLGSMINMGNIQLPLPRRINDSSFHSWSEISAMSAVANMVPGLSGGMGGAISTVASLGSVYAGKQLNPFMFMMYQRPGYKEHDLNWMLTASNKEESDLRKEMGI